MNLHLHSALSISPFALFGIVILLGLIGGELVKRFSFLPKISGYIFIGFLAGPACLHIINQSALANTHILVDISLGLILFDLGRHLDFTWLRHDPSLLFMSIAESLLTLILTFLLLTYLGLPHLLSLIAATIAVATSPAVVMMVAHDIAAEGPVTRRTLILTSLNNLFALLLFTFILPLTQAANHHYMTIAANSLYRLLGSLLLGFIMFSIAKLFSYLTGKHKESQFILFIGIIVLTISLAQHLNFSIMLSLLTTGIAARNFDYKNTLMEVDLSWLARLLLILLFVVMGTNLRFDGLFHAALAVIALIVVRIIAKTLGVIAFTKPCRLTIKQAIAISLALTPMAGVAIGMSNVLSDYNPSLGSQLSVIISSVVAILTLIGPIMTQLAFIKTNEADANLIKGKS